MKVLFIDSVHPVLKERLSILGHQCINGTSWDRNQCKKQLPEMTGIVVRSRFPIDEDFLKHGVQLKFIARSGAGLENIDLDYANKHNIACFNASEGNRNAVGEHALGLLLSLFNKITIGNQEVRQGIWDREGNRGVELDGKTIGIIGYGNNGKAFAKKLSGFEVEVLAYDKYKVDYEDQYAKAATMDGIFERADVLSFHIPQNKETIRFANASFFEKFKRPIYLLNVARGKIVDTKALISGLQSGKIIGAGLDVLEYESASFEQTKIGNKNPEFLKLLQSKQVVFTPHVAGWTKESYFKLSNVLADKVIQFLKEKH